MERRISKLIATPADLNSENLKKVKEELCVQKTISKKNNITFYIEKVIKETQANHVELTFELAVVT